MILGGFVSNKSSIDNRYNIHIMTKIEGIITSKTIVGKSHSHTYNHVTIGDFNER